MILIIDIIDHRIIIIIIIIRSSVLDSNCVKFLQVHQLKDLSTAIAQSDVARRKKISTEKKDSTTSDKKNKS